MLHYYLHHNDEKDTILHNTYIRVVVGNAKSLT